MRYMKKGFTLIELLVVIGIMGILASVLFVTTQRGLDQSRDSRRIQELYQVAQSLQLYYTAYQQYPDVSDTDCTIHGIDWDAGNMALGSDEFVKPVYDENFMGDIQVREWTDITDAFGSACIYRYSRVEDPCDGQCEGYYGILYAACESNICPRGERPSCCDGSTWGEGGGVNDDHDIAIFLKE